jgi:hypothetical protein
MNLDDDLRLALKRQPPSPDFADRVLARIAWGEVEGGRGKGEGGRETQEGGRGKGEGGRGTREGQQPGRPALRWLAVAATFTLVAGAAVQYYAYQQNVAEAERLNAEIRLALQITSEKIAMVQLRLSPGSTYERSGRNP